MKKISRTENIYGKLFVAPQLIGMALFVILPLCFALYLSFCEWNLFGSPKWVGFENFRLVFGFDGDVFFKSIKNTAVLMAGIVPLTILLALGLAVLANRELRFLNFYKSALFMPMITSSVAIAMVWYWLFAPDLGFINYINATDWPEYYQKVAAEMAAGRAPDIGRVAESFMPTLIDRGQIVDMTDFVNTELDQNQYYMKTFENAGYVDGRYYGLPSGLYNYVLYYNKDLFDEAGIAYPSSDWNNPTSFEEIEKMAAALTKQIDGGMQFGFYSAPYMAEVGMYSKAKGGYSVFDDDGNPVMNSAITKDVYNWYDRMLTSGTMPTPTSTDIMDAMTMFTNNRLGMIVDGTWYLGMFGGMTDTLNVGIAAVPGVKGKPSYTSQFVDSFVMFTGTKQEAAAYKALAAIISKEGFEALAATGVGGIPVQREVSAAVTDTLLGDKFSEDGKACAKNSLDYTLKVPYNAFYQQADEKVNNMMGEWMLGQISADEFAEKVQDILLAYKAEAEK